MQLEVCIETLQEAELAEQYKCNRIEICSALDFGGITPSFGLIQSCGKLQGIESHILIRPRSGNFVYTTKEIILMKEDIGIAVEAGAKGVVFGCLNSENEIDIASCELLLRFAKALQLKTTFHRAIDFAQNYLQSIQRIIDLGFDRILTSGQKSKAVDGIEIIKSIADRYSGQIELMVGSGINAENVHLFQEIKIDAMHFSIRKKDKLTNDYSIGSNYVPDENKLNQIILSIKEYENH